MYGWSDPRISLNKTHPYWKNKDHQRQSIRLNNDFVEECLWTPKLQFFGISKMALWNPSPTSAANSKKQIYLASNGVVRIFSFNLKLTTTCDMNFDTFPFDRQVYMFI